MPIDMGLQDNPTQKKADDLLTQLGLHPSQVQVRQQLGLAPHGIPQTNDLISTATDVAGLPPKPASTAPAPETQTTERTATIQPEEPPPTIPTPGSRPTLIPQSKVNQNDTNLIKFPDLISQSQHDLEAANQKYTDLLHTPAHVDRIKNPFLHGLAKTGEIAGDLIDPGLMENIPGTEAHRGAELRDLAGTVKNREDTLDKLAGAEERKVTSTKLENTPLTTNDLAEFIAEHPGDPNVIEDYWKEKTLNTIKPPQSIEAETYKYLTDPQGGNMSPQDALAKIYALRATAKPETAQQLKEKMMGTLQKAMGDKPDPTVLQDVNKLGQYIAANKNIDPDEKKELLSYFVFNPNPDSQLTLAEVRAAALANAREMPVINRTDNSLQYANANTINKNPKNFVPAQQGIPTESKEAAFGDIHFNLSNLTDAVNNLQNPFSASQRAKFAYILRSNDPKSSLDSFLNSSAAETLTPDQVDFITSLVAMQENALMMRSIQGLGQGSDELRAAIIKLLPGPGTPNKQYALRQLQLFNGTVQRLEKGIPEVQGIEGAPSSPTAKGNRGNAPKGGKILEYTNGKEHIYSRDGVKWFTDKNLTKPYGGANAR